jgi:hypothetical protein
MEMDKAAGNKRLQLMAAYVPQLEDRDWPEPAAEYALELAVEFFGTDLENGRLFLQDPALWEVDPLKLAAALYQKQGTAGKKLSAELVWQAQIKVCLPLLEEERRCFIKAEYGRLLPLLGVDYWNRETGTYGVLWHYDIGARIDEEAGDALRPQGKPVADPYELDLPALALLGYLDKRIEMLGTVSYTPFFRMRSEDRERLVLLEEVRGRLFANQVLAPSELKKLLTGHAKFMNRG